MNLVDDLVIWGKRTVDPWNRLSCCHEPILLVIEFCQVQGPKPLYCVPSLPSPHLNLDSVAVWLMSGETVSGSTLVLYNQQMAVYACVRYSTILDVRARAFQRPISLALLTSIKPNTELLSLFMLYSQKLLSPLLACNRCLFRLHLSHLIDIADSIQKCNFENYYAICRDSYLSPNTSARIESIAVKARRLMPRLQAAYASLASSAKRPLCQAHSTDSVESCLTTIGNAHSAPLLPLQNLAPCAYGAFIEALAPCRQILIKAGIPVQSGTLFCAGRSILKLTEYGGKCNEIRDGELFELLSDDYIDRENILKSTLPSLEQMLFPILSGDRLAICASEQRKPSGIDLLKKLTLLRVVIQQPQPKQHVLWNIDNMRVPREVQIFGQSASRSASAKWSVESVNAILDLNSECIRSKEYSGKTLGALSRKRPSTFPSDRALIAYIVSLLTEFCNVVYLAKCRNPEKIAAALALSLSDRKILYNFLAEIDLLKYGHLKEELRQNDEEQAKTMKV
ncbi:hypothetical protein AB6A40_000114 [Gnathostoma spinigerum]|uniref:UDENN FLCN/SMCR8-type domain-containing protein n=1 Tax=Gnathostoma spinigerum TaxID=75299 RepID=A0ABD6E2E8_9BILA